MQATPRQTFAIFCAIKAHLGKGQDVRPLNLTLEQASEIISAFKANKPHTAMDLLLICGFENDGKPLVAPAPKPNKPDWEAVWNEAHEAGMKAGHAATPVPMVVVEHANPLNDNSPIVKRYAPVTDGVCGFASVVVHPGTCSFARWCQKEKDARANYYGGMTVKWVGEFNQSLTRKEEYANAFAQVLHTHGIKARVESRMD